MGNFTLETKIAQALGSLSYHSPASSGRGFVCMRRVESVERILDAEEIKNGEENRIEEDIWGDGEDLLVLDF